MKTYLSDPDDGNFGQGDVFYLLHRLKQLLLDGLCRHLDGGELKQYKQYLFRKLETGARAAADVSRRNVDGEYFREYPSGSSERKQLVLSPALSDCTAVSNWKHCCMELEALLYGLDPSCSAAEGKEFERR